MKCYKKTFSNGLRILLAPVKGTKTITSLVLIGTGSKYETKKLNGISHFLEHLFFKGTPKRPTTQIIAEELDRVGGMYNAFTGKEFTGYWVKVDGRHMELAIDVVSDMLLNPKFEKKEIEREKGVIIEELNMYYDTPIEYVGELYEELLYGNQPAGWQIGGKKENILKMTRNDIVDYKNRQYVANNAVVCLAGDLPSEKKALALVERCFKNLNEGDFKDKKPVQESQLSPQAKIFYKKTDQTHLVLGVRAFGLKHKDKYALTILATILGGNMSSRMFIRVRERQGLAYYVRTSPEIYTDTGYLATAAGVKNDQIVKAIQSVVSEYKKIKKEYVKISELTKAKDYIKGKSLISLESSNAVASFFGDQEILESKTETVTTLFKKIDRVTSRDVKRVAENIFKNKNLNLAMIGPFKDKSKFLRLLKF